MTACESKSKFGYSIYRLGRLFGERHKNVRGWVDRGLFGKPLRRGRQVSFSRRAVVRFVRDHAAEYSLARVDRQQFLALLYGWFPSLKGRTRGAA